MKFRALAGIVGLLGPAVLAPATSRAATVVVNDTSDTLHVSGCAATGTGTCSLRDGIFFANGNSGVDEIDFNVAGSGVHTIVLGSVLPTITGPVTIDGYTQPGTSANTNGFGLADNAVLLIEVDGNGVSGPSEAGGCIVLESGGHTIRGLVINRCGGAAIEVGPTLATGDLVAGNFIGTDPTGMTNLGNGGPGVYIGNGSGGFGDVIGGADPADRNVIAGNQIAGVEIDGHSHTVSGNLIGTNAAGTAAIGNVGPGVYVDDGVGSASPPGCCTAPAIFQNLLSGNLAGITTDETGGYAATANYIGTDVTGSAAVPNGVGISGLGGGGVGGPKPGDGNVISGNTTYGVWGDVTVQGNLIGTDASGLQPLGNGAAGVFNDTLEVIVLGNVIAYNGAADPIGGGVVIGTPDHFEGAGKISGNSIFANTSDGSIPNRGLGIDNGGDGPTANDDCDADSGPNGLQNFPVLTSAVSSGSSTEIQGTLDTDASATFLVEFFSNATCDSNGRGQGKVFLGSVDVATDASCNASFDVVLPVGVAANQFVMATASTPAVSGFTSEFSPCLVVTAPGGLQVFSIAPTSGAAEGGTAAVVTGDGFLPSLTLTIGGVSAGAIVVPSSTEIDATSPALTPGTLNDVVVTVPDLHGRAPLVSVTLAQGWFADFLDVPQDDIFHAAVESIFRAGITAGCGGGNYCRDDAVTRAQMAVFLLKAEHGSAYVPPTCTGIFDDVTCPSQFADWIEQLSIEGITAGCGGANYCPDEAVKRKQMAVFLLKTSQGSGYAPPAAAGIFDDVPPADPFAAWIEDLFNRGITGGCQVSPPLFCPENPNTRGQMAVFLSKTFNLP